MAAKQTNTPGQGSNDTPKPHQWNLEWCEVFRRFWDHLYFQGWVANAVVSIALGFVFLLVSQMMKNPKTIVVGATVSLTALLWALAVIFYRSIPSNEPAKPTAADPAIASGRLRQTEVLLSPNGTSLLLEIGDSGAMFRWDPALNGPALKVFDDSNLTIEREANKLLVSTRIRDATGKPVAEIIKNDWRLRPSLLWDRNFNDNALVLLGHKC